MYSLPICHDRVGRLVGGDLSAALASAANRVAVRLALTWGYFVTLRLDGVTGGFSAEYSYRWTPTAEDRTRSALATRKQPPTALVAVTTSTLAASGAIGPVSAGRNATIGCRASALPPIGPRNRPSNYGSNRSGRAGRRLPSSAAGCSRRSSATPTKS